MNRLIVIGAAVVFSGLAIAPLSAQTQSTTTTSSTTYLEASKLIGTKVKAEKGEEVGEIKDVVLNSDGCMAYTVLSTTGGGGRSASKTVVVPWTVYSTTSDPRVLTVRVDKEKIYNGPAFEYSRIRDYSNPTWLGQVSGYYGVSASVGVTENRGAYSTENRTNVNESRGMGYGAAPSPNARPGASASPYANPNASASPGGTAPQTSASASPGSSPMASPEASRSMTPESKASRHESPTTKSKSSKSRGENESANEGSNRNNEETTESGNSASSEGKKVQRHAKHSRSTSEPSSSASPGEGNEKE